MWDKRLSALGQFPRRCVRTDGGEVKDGKVLAPVSVRLSEPIFVRKTTPKNERDGRLIKSSWREGGRDGGRRQSDATSLDRLSLQKRLEWKGNLILQAATADDSAIGT